MNNLTNNLSKTQFWNQFWNDTHSNKLHDEMMRKQKIFWIPNNNFGINRNILLAEQVLHLSC